MNADAIRERLLAEGREIFEAPVEFVEFTGVQEADELLNDLENYPHAYVIGCIMQAASSFSGASLACTASSGSEDRQLSV